MSVRRLASLPATYDFVQVAALTRQRFEAPGGPALLDVNEVKLDDGPAVAVYWENWSPSAASLTAWRSEVAAHVPASPTTTEQAASEAAKAEDLRRKLTAALAANDAAIASAAAWLAIAKPGTAAAQASSAYDQVKTLTQGSIGIRRQLNGLIQLGLGLLDTAADT